MTFYVGQKVVCVGPAPGAKPYIDRRSIRLVLKRIYTVRDVDCRSIGLPDHDVPTLRFEEMYNPIEMTCVGAWELGYQSTSFRPIIERKTDISCFTAMLTPSDPRKVSA